VTLPNTDIDLPLVLMGPPGIFLVNVLHERGVYRARDDEWGTVVGEKFVPAAINHVARTEKLGRVLQIYLERTGFRNTVVNPVLMAANPGLHVETVRPVVRIVMSDALERFAMSMNQSPSEQTTDNIAKIAHVILQGVQKTPAAAVSTAAVAATPTNAGNDTTDALFSSAPDLSTGSLADSMGFSFNDEEPAEQTPYRPAAAPQRSAEPVQRPVAYTPAPQPEREAFQWSDSPAAQSADSPDDLPSPRENPAPVLDVEIAKPTPPAAKKKGPLGLTTPQLAILGGLLLCWLCSMIAFSAYLYFQLNG